jgi:hypothetical protein
MQKIGNLQPCILFIRAAQRMLQWLHEEEKHR